MHPCHSFLRREDVLGIGHLVVVLFRRCISFCNSSSCFADVYLFAISASYAIDDVGGGAREVISDLNGSLGSRYFVGVVNERTS